MTCTLWGSDTAPVATHAPVARQSHYALVMYGVERVERTCRFGPVVNRVQQSRFWQLIRISSCCTHQVKSTGGVVAELTTPETRQASLETVIGEGRGM